jgi:hypothetical protein
MRTKLSARVAVQPGLSMLRSATEPTFGASPAVCENRSLSSMATRSASPGRVSLTVKR